MTLDATDCEIEAPSTFSPKWFSFKFNEAGLRYEIAVNISETHIIWVNGLYPCVIYPDLRVFPERLRVKLDVEEKVIADRGYRDSKCEYLPNDLPYRVICILTRQIFMRP